MLILLQRASANVPNPPAGKSTLFVDTNGNFNVLNSNGGFGSFNGSFVAIGNVDLGPVGNIFIGNGSNGQVLKSFGANGHVYWDTDSATPGGTNTQIQFNDAGALGGNTGFTFDKATGVLSVTGNISAGNVGATTFTGALSGAATTAGTVTTAAQPNITSTGTLVSLSVSGNANIGNVGTAGVFASTLSATGNSNIGNLSANIITATGTVTGGNLVSGDFISAAGNVTGANIFTAGQVNANGNIIVQAGGFFIGNGSQLSGIDATAIQNGNSNVQVIANGIVTTSVSGNANVFAVLGTGIQANGNVSASGTVTGGNVSTGGVISATGNITGANLFTGGIVSATSNVSGGNITTAGQVSATGNISGGNISGGNLYATLGEVKSNTANITSLLVANVVTASGNVTGANIVTAGLVTATGNIVSNANIVTDLIVGRTQSVTITATGTNQNINLTPTGSGTVNVGNFIISNVATPLASTDAATKQYVDDVAQGLHTHDSCNAATTTTLATISGGTVTYNNGTAGVGATLTTTGSYTTIDGVTLSDGMRILVKDEVTTANNGIYVRTSSTVLTRADDFNTPAEMAGGDFTFVTAGTVYDNTGWVMPDPVTTVGTTPVLWVQFSGAGTYTAGTGLTLNGSVFNIANTTVVAGAYGNGDYNATFTVNGQGQLSAAANVAITANAGNLSGTVLKSTVVASSLTSVGTLTSLSISGNANIGNVGAAAGVFTSVSGNGSGLSSITGGNVTGQVGNALVAGTVYTAAQSNITSVGTLASLSVSGNANVGNIGAGAGIYTTLSASGNVNGGNLVSTGTIGATGATHLGNTFTTGANTTTATVTGNFSLSTGSRFQATYA